MSPDVELALLHVPKRSSDALRALFAIDSAMGDVVARSTEPALGRIKLAWWREQLEALDESPPPAEPRLQAVAEHLLPIGLTGGQVAALEPGWATLLDEQVEPRLIAERGRALFEMGGTILGGQGLPRGGELWALVDVARHCADPGARDLLMAEAGAQAALLEGYRAPADLRPITGLARLAARDLKGGEPFEPEGGRGRALALLAHRWSGRIG